MPVSIDGEGLISGLNEAALDLPLAPSQVTGLADAWTAYTPTLTASGSNPTLGSGSTQSGQYRQIGKTVDVTVFIAFGSSGMATGSGFYKVSLPVAAKSNVAVNGIGYMEDVNAGSRYALMVSNSDSASSVYLFSATALVSDSAPWTWQASDFFKFTATYEAA